MNLPEDERKLIRLILFLALLPLVLGLSTYALWRVTGWDDLFVGGILIMIIGTFAVFTGIGGVIVFLDKGLRSRSVKPRKLVLQCLGLTLLLLLNFPAALFCVASAMDLRTRYEVTVINESNQTAENFTLTGPEEYPKAKMTLGHVKTSRRARAIIDLPMEGQLHFSYTQGPIQVTGIMDEYYTFSMGASVQLYIQNDGRYEVIRR